MLADDESSAPPIDIVKFYSSKIPLKYLQLPHAGVSATRQAALEVCQGEFALITDDDCRPAPGLLRAYASAVERFPGCALGGPVLNLLAGHHAALTLLGRKDLDPWEVNTERSYYEEQVLSPDKKHEGADILIADKAPPHESV